MMITEVKLLQKPKLICLTFSDGCYVELPCAYLRAHSPSAAMRGLSEDEKVMLSTSAVNVVAIEPVGNYALKITFDDGHDTGLYSFDLLYSLGQRYGQ